MYRAGVDVFRSDDDIQDVEQHREASCAALKKRLNDVSRRLRKLLRRNQTPKAILLSGGGNDIAGDELRFEAELFREALPEKGKVTGFVHQDLVAG